MVDTLNQVTGAHLSHPEATSRWLASVTASYISGELATP